MPKEFSSIVCTYKRASSLKKLLDTVQKQSLYPNQVLIIDGSPDDDTKRILQNNQYKGLKYHKVKPEERGLTKQRNIGVSLCNKSIDIVCFLDDDITLDKDYFKNLIKTYRDYPDAVAVGGYINNEAQWELIENRNCGLNYFCYDKYCRLESKRYQLRKKIGLAPDRPPGFLPKFSHGRSVGHLPPTGKIYEVEQFMGGVSSCKVSVFKHLKFSTYFEGYGLYEDADFCFRLIKYGKLYVNTTAQCDHHHHPSGRPNRFEYGKMVVKNGWYVWRLRWEKPGLKNKIKWYSTSLLLAFLRFLNTFTTRKKTQAFTESMGRFLALLLLLFNKPSIRR